MLSLNQLKTFLEVAAAGSVRAASETLVISQPAVSAALAGLQREVGAPLVVRNGRGDRAHGGGRTAGPRRPTDLRAHRRGHATRPGVRHVGEPPFTISSGHDGSGVSRTRPAAPLSRARAGHRGRTRSRQSFARLGSARPLGSRRRARRPASARRSVPDGRHAGARARRHRVRAALLRCRGARANGVARARDGLGNARGHRRPLPRCSVSTRRA